MGTNTVTFKKLAALTPHQNEQRQVAQKRKRSGVDVARLLGYSILATKAPSARHLLIDAGEHELQRYSKKKINQEFY